MQATTNNSCTVDRVYCTLMECRNGYHEDSDENASASQSQTLSSHEDNQPA